MCQKEIVYTTYALSKCSRKSMLDTCSKTKTIVKLSDTRNRNVRIIVFKKKIARLKNKICKRT